MKYDLAILGGGPGGYVAAIKAAQLGAKVVLIEKERVGGTCLNHGCIPTKALLQTVESIKRVNNAREFGIDISGFSVDFRRVMKRKERVVNKLVKGVAYLLKENGVELINGTGIVKNPFLVQITTGQGETKQVEAERIILANGSVPLIPPIKGITGQGVITSREVLKLTEIPEELVIIGGGVIGVELATIFNSLGSMVTIVEMLPQILPREDEEISAVLKKSLERDGVTIMTSARVEKVSHLDGRKSVVVTLSDADKEIAIAADRVLVAVGRKANLAGLGELDLKFNKGVVQVNRYLETNLPAVYAIGDLIGGAMLAHKASAEAIIAVENALGDKKEMDYSAVPSCVYTFPEVSSTGLTEKQALDKGYKIKVGSFPFSASGKAATMGEKEGFVKIIADERWMGILGVHIIGPHATELIAEAVLAIKLEATVEELTSAIHAHPSLSEAVMEAAHAVKNEAIHIP